MNDMKRLLRYAGPYRRDMVLGAVLVLIETCFELFIPNYDRGPDRMWEWQIMTFLMFTKKEFR